MQTAIMGVSRWLRVGYGASLLLTVSCTFQMDPDEKAHRREATGTAGPSRGPHDGVAPEMQVHDVQAPDEPLVSDECLNSPSADACCEDAQVVTLGTPRRDHFVLQGGHDSGHQKKDRCVLTFASDDFVSTGEGDDLIHGGDGNDHLKGDGGDDVIIGGGGSDNIEAGSGDDSIVPGSGKDHVNAGRGDDTVTIFDTCEAPSDEVLQGGPGNDTLVTPVSVAELTALGVTVEGFENVVVQNGSCQSECAADVPDCSDRGTCVNGDAPGEMSCDCDPGFSGDNCQFESVTAEAGGFAYIEQCDANEVPTPPVWNYEDAFHNVNGTKWVNDGPLVWPFISQGLVAEAFYYESTDPPGVCVALPRSTMDSNGIPVPDGIGLLGVICQGTVSSKACFWDSKNVDRFDTMNFTDECQFTNGNYLTPGGDPCFMGGTDLAQPSATGGTCTNCHRGENVFLIPNPFPDDPSGLTATIPQRMPAAWHDPIVDASWPDNPGPFVFTATPDDCVVCHNESVRGTPVFGGRFPALTVAAADYCGAVGRTVFDLTMPVGTRQRCLAAGDCTSGICEAGGVPGTLVCKDSCTTNANCPMGYLCNTGTSRCELDLAGFPSYQELLESCP
jgi:hypothetical protein